MFSANVSDPIGYQQRLPSKPLKNLSKTAPNLFPHRDLYGKALRRALLLGHFPITEEPYLIGFERLDQVLPRVGYIERSGRSFRGRGT